MHGESMQCVCCYTANGILKNPRIAAAMKAIDRGLFSKNNPYMDAPQGIGYAVTISAPHMVITRTEYSVLLCFEFSCQVVVRHHEHKA